MDWQRHRGDSEIEQAALDGLAVASEESSDAADAAVSELECFAGRIQATLPFVESRIREPHRVFDNGGIGIEHTGVLPGERDLSSQSLPTKPRAKNPKWDS